MGVESSQEYCMLYDTDNYNVDDNDIDNDNDDDQEEHNDEDDEQGDWSLKH